MSCKELTATEFIDGIAKALHEDFGDTSSTVKIIGELTGAAPGTVKKWLAKHNGPGGEMLVKLLAVSPAVRRFVDTVTHREDQIVQREQDFHRAVEIMSGRADPGSGNVIELVPTLQADLFGRPRPAAPNVHHHDRAPLRRAGGAG